MASEAAEIREAIEQTRVQLGETVQALAEKADVKAQVHKKLDEAREQARQAVRSVPDRAAAGKRPGWPALAAVALMGALALLRRRHRRARARAAVVTVRSGVGGPVLDGAPGPGRGH